VAAYMANKVVYIIMSLP